MPDQKDEHGLDGPPAASDTESDGVDSTETGPDETNADEADPDEEDQDERERSAAQQDEKSGGSTQVQRRHPERLAGTRSGRRRNGEP